MEIGEKYADADGYDAYMGGWSSRLAAPFLDFASVLDGRTIVDLGCGTGNLLAAAAMAYRDAKLIGIEPSSALLAKAKRRSELAGAMLLEGEVAGIPLEDATADFMLSLLVLQEFSDRSAALAEMRRVTRSGGTIAGCQWDFARMPIITNLMLAIEVVRPEAAQAIALNSPKIFSDESELLSCWQDGGLVQIRTGRITVVQTFNTFDDLWLPLLAGSTPSTLTLASMSHPEQRAVRSDMQVRIGSLSDGPIAVSAEAIVVAGLS